jgi:hypothetical protein
MAAFNPFLSTNDPKGRMPLFPKLSARGGEAEFLQSKNSNTVIRHGGWITVAPLRGSLVLQVSRYPPINER